MTVDTQLVTVDVQLVTMDMQTGDYFVYLFQNLVSYYTIQILEKGRHSTR